MSRPGLESILIPREGTVQEWITSIEVVKIRVEILKGRMSRLSTSKSRNSFIFNDCSGIIKESNSTLVRSEYSYLQYHWCPIALIDNWGNCASSVRYKILSDGIAIMIKMSAGVIVQINSMVWPCKRNRLMKVLKDIISIM